MIINVGDLHIQLGRRFSCYSCQWLPNACS